MAGRKKKRTGLWVLFIVAALLIAAFFLVPRILAGRLADTQNMVSSYTVGRGDVEVTITSSGSLEAEDTQDVDLPVGIEVDTVFSKAGDVVRAGDVLATLNTTSLQNRAAELSADLASLDRQLGSRKTSSTIKTSVKGRVKYLPVAVDEDVIEAVNRYGALAILSTDGLMQVEVQTDAALALNGEVTVQWDGGSETGTVVSKLENGYMITFDDTDAPYLGTAEVYSDKTLIGTGTMQLHAPLAIFGNGGTIEKIHVKMDARVYSGGTLFTLDNEPATDSYRQTLADRVDKAEQLQTILMYQNSPNVIAPVDGVISEVSITEGKETTAEGEATEMNAFTLGTGGAVKMTVDVDELDINSIAVGQTAAVTLDAFSTETFTATVTRISHIGEESGSITVYKVDLLLDYDDRLMDGMNGSAVIMTDSVQNVIVIPLGAVHEDVGGSYVYVLDASDMQGKTYISTGLSDGNNAEVTQGLNEGDRIVYSAASLLDGITSVSYGGGGIMRRNTSFSNTEGAGNE